MFNQFNLNLLENKNNKTPLTSIQTQGKSTDFRNVVLDSSTKEKNFH